MLKRRSEVGRPDTKALSADVNDHLFSSRLNSHILRAIFRP